MPEIIYGTAWKKTRTADLVARAIELGFRAIDTACQPKHYDEAAVGVGIARCLSATLTRPQLYLQTKFTSVSGQDPRRIPYDSGAPLAEQVVQSFAVSLRNLATSYLDCLVLHSPLATRQATLEVWRAMEGLADAGGARLLGISNCYDIDELRTLQRAARVKPTVVQNRFYAATGYDREIRAFCRAEGIAYQSFWTLSANPQLLAAAAITTLAARHRRTPAQILYRYLTQEGIVPLTGTTSDAHMREDLEIFTFELAPAERDGISALLSRPVLRPV